MKIQIFASTAMAISIMIEAVEKILDRKVRLGKQKISFSEDGADNEAKVIHLNGELIVRGAEPITIEIGASLCTTPRVNKIGGISRGTFFLQYPDGRNTMHSFVWDESRDEPRFVL